MLHACLTRQSDKEANDATTTILDRATGELKPATWVDVQVGDVIQVKNREGFPADVILLAAHEPDPSNPHGACSVETKSLDGETNLKEKTAPAFTRSAMGNPPRAPNPRVSSPVRCNG